MKVVPPPGLQPPSPRAAHARRCFLIGITDAAKVARLWEEERAVAARSREADGFRPGNRHGRGRRGTATQ